MKWQFILVIGLIILVVFLTYNKTEYLKIKIASITIKAEIANTPSERIKGLMEREKFPLNQGMIFIFDKKDRYPFWMHNTKIPLDMIWMNESSIVYIVENAQPCDSNCGTYWPDENALYVLEVNAGIVKRDNLKTGDAFEII